MTLSQRLTRAGLTFILLGSVAAIFPVNDMAMAFDQQCGSSTTYYRLTNQSNGNADTTTDPQPSGTSLNFYVFTGTETGNGVLNGKTPYTPASFSTTGSYSGTASGNQFTGTTNNTTGSDSLSSISAQVPSGTLMVSFTVTKPPLTTAPTGFSAVARPTSVPVDITFNAVPGADSYDIYRSTTPGTTPSAATLLKNVTTTTTSDSGSMLLGNTVYYYSAEARNSGGDSPQSNEVKTTTIPQIPTNAVATPSSTTVNGTTTHKIVVTWNSSLGGGAVTPVTYTIKRKVGSGNYTTISGVTITDPTTSYTDTPVTAGTTYNYIIISANTTGSNTNGSIAATTTAT